MYKHPILDFNQLNNEMISLKIPAYQKLAYIYERMGGVFLDKEKRLIKEKAQPPSFAPAPHIYTYIP